MHALIVCNGFPPPDKLLRTETSEADLVIGADGGGNILLAHDLVPDVIIGDLDSFVRPETVAFKLIKDPDQDTNDLEKALKYALSQNVATCSIVGAFGQRMDHSLKNLSVMKQFNDCFKELYFVDEYQKVFLLKEPLDIRLPKGTIISLFPLSGEVTGITTKGLMYPLDDDVLKNGVRDGTSNETVQEQVHISHEKGDLLVFIER
ncbi:thiamine diphosphokinase [Balneola sp. MJW-20]|uniref:thiamine diphosphokinase n=1 Tax=Gracilimonas aurantiaca TaxID=3234185 RepID=UPI003467DF8F